MYLRFTMYWYVSLERKRYCLPFRTHCDSYFEGLDREWDELSLLTPKPHKGQIIKMDKMTGKTTETYCPHQKDSLSSCAFSPFLVSFQNFGIMNFMNHICSDMALDQ